MSLQFGFVIFWCKKIGAKASCKMLVKFIKGRVNSSANKKEANIIYKNKKVFIYFDLFQLILSTSEFETSLYNFCVTRLVRFKRIVIKRASLFYFT